MRMNKLFTLTLAALTFAGCSNDDNLENEITNGDGQTGELVETMTVSFVNPKSASSRADGDAAGTEDKVYRAYVFAREATPGHAGAQEGDWSVKEVKGADNPGSPETLGLDPIQQGSVTEAGTLRNLATFSNVALGDSVYVIVNDPSLSLEQAENLARHGKTSQTFIRTYISNLNKAYLNGLSFAKKAEPKGAFIMGGSAMIPLTPAVPNGTNVLVDVALDRELAKAFFNVSVTTEDIYAAFGKATIKADDGAIVVRVPRKVCYFTPQAPNFYYPVADDVKAQDWNTTWKSPFDGMTMSAPATANVEFFNKTLSNVDAAEYRYTWAAGNETDGLMEGKRMITPTFYVTPNYSNNAMTTCVVAQVTYTGINTLIDKVTEKLPLASMMPTIYQAMSKDATTNGVFEKTGVMIPLKEVAWDKAQVTAFRTYAIASTNEVAITAGLEAAGLVAADYATFVAKLTEMTAPADETTGLAPFLDYQKDVTKMFYRADIAEYDAKGEVSKRITERNTYYQMVATITSLGAKTIDDAIKSDKIGMIVQVTVKPWKVKAININL